MRFVEVIVNGPKSWTLAAELHPDVATAYEAAQDKAAEQIIGWLGRTRPPASVRADHRSPCRSNGWKRSRCGTTPPAPVTRTGICICRSTPGCSRLASGVGWTRSRSGTASRRSTGSGTPLWSCDPDFRAALAAHGYTLTRDGEIGQLASFVGPFSRRAAQIGALD